MINMELTPEDKQVVDLLSKLKSSSGEYPSEILSARRQAYLKQVADVGLGIGISAGLKNGAKGGNGAGAAGIVSSKILETVLIAAIAVEAGTATYLYRTKLADLVKSYTNSARVQEVTRPADDTSSLKPLLIETLELPSATITTPSDTPLATPSDALGSETASGSNASNISVNATPKPGGNNGNQYGLTPKPVRTKENKNTGGNNNGGSSGNNNGNGKNNKP